MTQYAENIYNSLRRKGLGPQYECAGIYCILLEDMPVYIGKSVNILRRMAQHYAELKEPKEQKYRVLAEAKRRGFNVRFAVYYRAQASGGVELDEELGARERDYIRAYRPPLNTQIPKAEDWHKYDTNEGAQSITFADLLELL